MTIWELIALAKSSGKGSMFHFKGAVNTINDLPETGEDGDVYLVDSEDSYFAWDGEGWTDVGNIFTIEDEEDLEKARTALQPEDLEPYRTATAQNVIDDAQDDRLDDLEQATTAATVGPSPIVTFDASAADMPLKQVVVDIEPVQAGSGDPSPDNVRPISGWTECNVARMGKNLINAALTYQHSDGILRIGANNNDFALKFPAGQYTFSCAFLNGVHYALYMQYVGGSSITLIAQSSSADTVTFSLENKPFRMWFYHSNGVSIDNVANIQLERGTVSTAYEAYRGDVYSIVFPTEAGTVYGGTLDVVNGKLTVDMASVDLGTLTWEKTSGGFYQTQKSRIGAKTGTTDPLLCSCYPYMLSGIDKFLTQTSSNIRIVDSAYADLETFVSVVTGQTMVYPLASPVSYDLTAEQITTLLGTNNIWADCGDVTVTYGAYLETLKASLDRTNGELDTLRACIAPIENGATASQAYAAGAYFFRNGSFCTALTSISSGAAFTFGTNYQTTTVAAALIALQS